MLKFFTIKIQVKWTLSPLISKKFMIEIRTETNKHLRPIDIVNI